MQPTYLPFAFWICGGQLVQGVPFDVAEEECHLRGGHLLTITNYDEFKALREILKPLWYRSHIGIGGVERPPRVGRPERVCQGQRRKSKNGGSWVSWYL